MQYLETGIILKVRPRVTKDGMVFLDIVQEVSTPGRHSPMTNGNVRINTRKLKTEAAVQSGDTMHAGRPDQRRRRAAALPAFPGLSRIPVIGGLFGKQNTEHRRNEIIILITADHRPQPAGSARPHRRIRAVVPRDGTAEHAETKK